MSEFGYQPFATPSAAKPATVILPQEWINEQQLETNLEQQLEAADEFEESFADSQLNLSTVDDFEDTYTDRVPSRKETPCFSPDRRFVSKKEYKRESNATTVLELSKLVNTLQKKQPTLLDVITGKYVVLLAILVAISFMMMGGYKPYCTSSTSWLPCENCPHYGKCNAFAVVACQPKDDNNHDLTVMDGRICVRSDEVGKAAYKLANIGASILEKKAWLYECAGRESSKNIPREELRADLLEAHEKGTSEDPLKEDVQFSPAFEEMSRLWSNNQHLYQIGHNKPLKYSAEDYYSYRFDSAPFRCYTSALAFTQGINTVKAWIKSVIPADPLLAENVPVEAVSEVEEVPEVGPTEIIEPVASEETQETLEVTQEAEAETVPEAAVDVPVETPEAPVDIPAVETATIEVPDNL